MAGRPGQASLATAVGLCAALVVAAASPGRAANLRALPSLALEQTWDTNIFNTPSDEQSDFISRATPSLTFSLESARTTLNLTGFVISEWYADHHDLSKWDATKLVELTDPEIRITERMFLQASARYFESNDIGSRSALGLTAIPGLPPTETFVVGRTAAREYGGSAQGRYRVTPTDNVGIGGGATKLEYLDVVSGLIGSRTVTGNVSVSHQFSPRTTGGVFGSTGYSTYDSGSDSRTYTGGVSATYAATERTTIDARAGMTFLTDSAADGLVDHSQSPYGALSIGYRDLGFSAAVAGTYEMTGGGSFGGATERTNANLSVADNVTASWSWNFSGGYQLEQSVDPLSNARIQSVYATAEARYAAAEWLVLRLAAYTFRQWTHAAVDADISRSHVLLGLTLSDSYVVF